MIEIKFWHEVRELEVGTAFIYEGDKYLKWKDDVILPIIGEDLRDESREVH